MFPISYQSPIYSTYEPATNNLVDAVATPAYTEPATPLAYLDGVNVPPAVI